MFKMASVCCNTTPQAKYPGWCRGSDGFQGDIIPCIGQHFLQHFDGIDFRAHRLQTWEEKWPDTKVHDIQIWTFWWPIGRNDEVWSVSLESVDGFGCSMCFCAVSLHCLVHCECYTWVLYIVSVMLLLFRDFANGKLPIKNAFHEKLHLLPANHPM